LSSGEILIKVVIIGVILYAIYMPLGYLYRKRSVNTSQIAAAGAVAGAASGLVVTGPDFDPVGATVIVTLLLAATAGVSSIGWMRVFDRIRDNMGSGSSKQ
jgi:hypothetical protein